jgi:ligand-binding sensor domain-containing protein
VVWSGGPKGLTAYRHGELRTLLRIPVAGLAIRGADVVVTAGGYIFTGSFSGLYRQDIRSNGLLSADAEGIVWFGCGTQVCSLSKENTVHRLGLSAGVPESNWIGAVHDTRGPVSVWNSVDTFMILAGHAYNIGVSPNTNAGELPGDPYTDHAGRTWMEGERWLENDRSVVYYPASGNVFHPVFGADSSGSLWAGSAANGLLQMSAHHWISPWTTWYRAAEGENLVRGCESITRAAGDALFAACADGVFEFEPGTRRWNKRELPANATDAVGVASAGGSDLWTILKLRGLFRIDVHGRIVATAHVREPERVYRTLFRDRSGRLWLGTKGGVFEVDEKRPAIRPHALEGGNYAVAFATGPDGQAWLGYDGGIARLDHGDWKREIPAERLASSSVGSIAVGPGPEFWVSYRTVAPFSRLYREDGVWKRQDFSAESGYGPLETRFLLRDRRGWLWRGTKEGLFVSDGRHLRPEDWIAFSSIHNLPGDSVSPLGLYEDRDGSVWVATNGGVAQIEPDPAWFDPLPAEPIRLTRVRWQGRENLWPGKLDLPGGASDLEIDFAQWPTPLPRQRVLEYRLTPADSNWRTTLAGTSRYDALAPGSYTFEVRDRFGSSQTWSIRVARDLPFIWLWWLAPLPLVPGAWWAWSKRTRDRYWRDKAQFLKVQNDGGGGGESGESDESKDRSGLLVAGRYMVVAPVGEGGFADVWRARDMGDLKDVAIKFLVVENELAQWQRERFEKETSALRRMEHPGIVRLLDSGWLPEGGPWLALTLIDGPSLRRVLRSGPVPRDRAALWTEQLGDALAEAHSAGVIHRDLKPENILIEPPPERDARGPDRAVVIDFGAAAVHNGVAGNRSVLLLGSLDYLAPERVQGRSSAASDVYSLAAVVFEMLTGIRYTSLADGSESGIRRALPHFGEAVAAALARGLGFNPEDRPADIREYARGLSESISEEIE